MVDRHAEKQAIPLTVVDLDGTYVSCNTLERYIMIGLKHHLCRFRLFSAIGVIMMVTLRRLRFISHTAMKFTCLRLLDSDRSFHGKFVNDVLKHLNTDVKSLLDDRRQSGHRILLATAAPDLYVPMIWDGDFVATQTENNPEHLECRGEEKLRLIIRYASANSCFIDTVITDHHDDAPLLEYNHAGTNILVRPSCRTLRFFREFKPAHFLLIEDTDKLGIAR